MWCFKMQTRWIVASLLVGGVLSAIAQQPPPLPTPKPQPPPSTATNIVKAPPGVVQSQPPAQTLPPPAALIATSPPPAAVVPPLSPTNLVADADSKSYTAKATDPTANFTFTLTNIASTPIVINSVQTSCGCTVAKVPPLPWTLDPGTNGPIEVSVNLAGKAGTFAKSVTVASSAGTKYLVVNITMPPPVITQATNSMERERNMQLAKADRQAVFKGDCARCHGEVAAQGKSGKELYDKVCGVCHEAEHRAELVTDLHHLKIKPDDQYWRNWINAGKTGTMMPAFAKAEGGPLNEEQVNSLVHYLSRNFAQATAQTGPARPVIVQPLVGQPVNEPPGLRPVPVRQ